MHWARDIGSTFVTVICVIRGVRIGGGEANWPLKEWQKFWTLLGGKIIRLLWTDVPITYDCYGQQQFS